MATDPQSPDPRVRLRNRLGPAIALAVLASVLVLAWPAWAEEHRSGAADQATPATSARLALATEVPAVPNSSVTLTVTFTASGHLVSSAIFSLDYDEDALALDPADGDGNGVPDAVVFRLPRGLRGSASFDSSDTDGEIDVLIYDSIPPLAALVSGQIVSVTLQTLQPISSTLAVVRFSGNPQASLGNTSGQKVPVTTGDGSVWIEVPIQTPTSTFAATATQAATASPMSTSSSTPTPSPDPTSTPTITPTITPTPNIPPSATTAASPTSTISPTSTQSPTSISSPTPTTTPTPTPTPSPTSTRSPTPTGSPTPTPTAPAGTTMVPTVMVPTVTRTPAAGSASTTPTHTASQTAAPTTNTPSTAWTATPATPTATSTVESSTSATPPREPSPTPPGTPAIATPTATAIGSPTPSASQSSTPWSSVTPSGPTPTLQQQRKRIALPFVVKRIHLKR